MKEERTSIKKKETIGRSGGSYNTQSSGRLHLTAAPHTKLHRESGENFVLPFHFSQILISSRARCRYTLINKQRLNGSVRPKNLACRLKGFQS